MVTSDRTFQCRVCAHFETRRRDALRPPQHCGQAMVERPKCTPERTSRTNPYQLDRKSGVTTL